MNKRMLMFLFFIFILGCANPYSKFYIDRTGGADISKLSNFIPSNEKPRIINGNNQELDYLQMLEDGYALIGYSSFNGADVNQNNALRQAYKVHASVVLVYSQYTNTLSGSVPLTLPDSQRATTNLYGSSYGQGGFSTFSGTSNTTIYGSKTTYLPYNVARYDYLASYWVKTKPSILGIHMQNLTPELRQKVGSNRGVLVIAVIKNTPAFLADIFRGDVLKKIGEIEIIDVQNCIEAIHLNEGKKTTVLILRDGKEIEKEIIFNNEK